MELLLRRNNKRRMRGAKRKRSSRYWILSLGATGAIIAFTIGGSHRVTVAYAEKHGNSFEISKTVDDRFAQIEFNIPEGPLETVLGAFEIGGIVTKEGPSDHSPYFILAIQDASRDLAHFV